MRIPYLKRRSKFQYFEGIIRQNKETLLTGGHISIECSNKGYDGDIICIIDEKNHDSFETDWKSTDPTRFPARIKAAAHALFQLGYFGKFKISHKKNVGILEILKLRYEEVM